MLKRIILTIGLVTTAGTASARIAANGAVWNGIEPNALSTNGIEPNGLGSNALVENGLAFKGAGTIARQRNGLRGVSVELPAATPEAK